MLKSFVFLGRVCVLVGELSKREESFKELDNDIVLNLYLHDKTTTVKKSV